MRQKKIRNVLPFDRIKLHRLHLYVLALKPFDHIFDLTPFTSKLKGDNTDLLGHAGLPDIKYNREFLAHFPN